MPNASASAMPYSVRPWAAAMVNRNKSGAADVPRLKMNPYTSAPLIPGRRKSASRGLTQLGMHRRPKRCLHSDDRNVSAVWARG
jgi:hypothetical protein